jgi:dCMP deaminase
MEWHEYFFNFARDASLKSKDPNKKVGCVIVDQNKRIISTGYNGFPQPCKEYYLSWAKPDKYGCVIHAELNALLYAKQSLENCNLYTTDAPCENCLKHIIQSGIKQVLYKSADIVRKKIKSEDFLTIRRLIKSSDITVVQYPSQMGYITDLRPSFPEEMEHPDGLAYEYKEILNGFHYLVVKKQSSGRQLITSGYVDNGQFISYNNVLLDEILDRESLLLSDLVFIKI